MGHKPFVREKPFHRPARFAERIKEELVGLVPAELKDPRLEKIFSLAITDVEVAADLKNATALFSLSEDEAKHAKEVAEILNRSANFIRREISFALASKVTPQIHFKFDKGANNPERIDELLKQAAPAKADNPEQDDE